MKCRGRRWLVAGWPETPKGALRQIIEDEASFNLLSVLLHSSRYPAQPPLRPSEQSIPLWPRSSILVALKNLMVVLEPTCLRVLRERGLSRDLRPLEVYSTIRAQLGSHGGDMECMHQRSGGGHSVYESRSRLFVGPLLFYLLAQPDQTRGPIVERCISLSEVYQGFHGVSQPLNCRASASCDAHHETFISVPIGIGVV